MVYCKKDKDYFSAEQVFGDLLPCTDIAAERYLSFCEKHAILVWEGGVPCFLNHFG
jgi:hypothetical protein